MNKKIFIMLSLAIIIAMAATAFPLHIEQDSPDNAIIRIGTGKGAYYLTIGSSVSAADADYICDGANDDVQFQAALDALPSTGGQIFVLAGNYTFADSTTVTRAIDNVSIIGVSAAASFTGDGSTAIFTAGGDGWLFSNIEVDSGGLDMGATVNYMWLHVTVDGTYYPLKTDSINIEDHSALHGVGGADTIFPPDPNADKYLMWDDTSGQLSWEDGGGVGDMAKATYDTDEDGYIDTAAGGTEWDSSAATGVAYITAGAWSTRSTGITNTYIVVVDGTPNAGEYARWTANGLEGRTESEFKQDYNLEIGTDIQGYDVELAAIAGLTSAADKLIYFTGSGTADTSDLTAFARSILDDADETTFKATVNLEIGTDVQAWDTDLDDIATLSNADNNFIVGNGTNWVVESGATVRESLGLIIGTDVQAYDTELAALAGTTSAADKVPYFTGSGTADVADLTSYGRSLIATVDELGFKQFTNLEIGVDIISKSTFDTHESATSGIHGVTGNILGTEDVDDTPVDGATTDPISSNWAYDHENDTSAHGVSGDIVGTSDSQTLSNKTLGSNLDFAGYMAIAMACDNGATMPTSPAAGQWFLHTPTGRNILYQYDGSSWIPIVSFGTMTLYVDKTDGTDDLNYGTGIDSNAFATIQYAVDCIPPNYGGDVFIYINDETYTESVTITGKASSGNYQIYLIGTLSEQLSEQTVTSAGQNDGVVGYVDVSGASWSNNAYQHMLISFEDDTTTSELQGDKYIIDSNDSDTISIACKFDATPANGDTFTVQDFATSITGDISIKNGQGNVNIKYIKISGGTLYIKESASAGVCCCFISDQDTAMRCSSNSYVDAENSYFVATGGAGGDYTVWFSNLAAGDLANCKVRGGGTGTAYVYALLAESNSSVYINHSIFENARCGIRVETGAVVRHWGGANNDSKVRDNYDGISCNGAAGVSGISHVDYSGNSNLDEATSNYGYVF